MLEELQSLTEANKRKVLIVTTIVAMVIIVAIWVTYFNSIVLSLPQHAVTQATSSSVVPAQTSGPGIWQDIKNIFSSIANIFRKPSQYNIQPQ